MLYQSSGGSPDFEFADILDTLGLSLTDSATPFQDTLEDVANISREISKSTLRICRAGDVDILNNCEPIGSGTSFTVFKGNLEPDNKFVAVKRLNIERVLGKSTVDAQKRRHSSMLASVLLELRVLMYPWFRFHPNVVKLLAVFWEDERETGSEANLDAFPTMVVELADENFPTLYEAIDGVHDVLSESNRFSILEDVAEALTVVHSVRMIHGDIKPENVLLFWNKNRYVGKISDFGFSRPSAKDDIPIGGTLYWNAPVTLRDCYRVVLLTKFRNV